MDNFEFETKKRKKLRKEPLYIIICLLCLVIGAGGGYFYRGSQIDSHSYDKDSLYYQIVQTIENDFLDTTDSEKSLQERILYGMVAALGDPHTSYLSYQQAQDFASSINGSVQGIGVTFTALDVGAIVLSVYKGTPADQAGLMNGDIITHVQGTSIEGYSSDKIKAAIQGEKGSEVVLKILRNGQVQEIKAYRGHVETSVSYDIRTSGDMKIGYLLITTFGEGTHFLVEEALKSFKDQNVQNIVLDVRGNGGGYLESARDILSLFIDQDEVLLRVQQKDGNEKQYKSVDCDKYSFENGFILVDGSSASASEIIIGALKEHLGYKVIGTQTYGKGTVQTQKTLSDSSVLKYTHAKWLTPHGVWVNDEGFKPDYEVKSTTLYDFSIGKIEESYRYDQVNIQVENLQKILKELGYKVDRTDGYFSKATENALKEFEKKYGLNVNGIYDQNDVTLLLSALAYHVYQEVDDKTYLKVEELIK